MKTKRIKVTVNPNPKHNDRAVATLTAPIIEEIDLLVPETVEGWVKMLGAGKLCSFVETLYMRRARFWLRQQMLDCVNKETGEYTPNREKFKVFIPTLSHRNERACKFVENYLEKVTDDQLQELIKKEAERRGINLA